MHGQSYAGWAQFAVASEAPDALKCIAPSQLFFETYTESLRPGGVLAEAWLQQFSDYLERFTDNDISRGFATAPVVDEDGDGELLDEIPINLGSGEPPLYSDHQQRLEHHYARVTEMHGANQQVDYMLDEQHAFIDAPIRFEGQDYLLVDTSPGVMLARSLLDSEIAVMHIGGLFDGFGHGAFKSYSTLAEHRFNRLFVAPRFHLPMEITDAYRELLDYSGSYADQLIFEELQFFDEIIKGFSRASEAEPPIKLYVANEGWRYLDQWPPEDSQMTPLFLKRQNGLSSQAERAMSVDTYQVD
jgi:predicted acyl esterase